MDLQDLTADDVAVVLSLPLREDQRRRGLGARLVADPPDEQSVQQLTATQKKVKSLAKEGLRRRGRGMREKLWD